jgi:hypothetical protein
LLDYGVYDAARAGFRRAVIVIRQEVEELFRRHVADVIGTGIEVVFARQALEPAVPGRTKPWGTGHAVLAAAWGIRGPFAVMNADDYYGAGAFRLLFDHLASAGDHALVGYTLRETTSAHGGVSRAIAELDAQGGGYLSRLTEVADIVGRGATYTGRTIPGETVTLDGSELVSMNLWGFTPALLPTLERQFARFLEARGTEPTPEFLLSEAVGAQVRAGDARVRVLPAAGSQWFGMTYSADDERVRDRIASLVNAGQYPTNLKAGLERLGCD